MNTLDLDHLKSRWTEQGRRLDASLNIDIEAMRRALRQRSSSAFRRHSLRLVLSLGLASVQLLALLVFMLFHWNQPTWLAIAGGFALLATVHLLVELREWQTLRSLDLDAPILEIREKLAGLQQRRLWLIKWVALLSVLFWLPLLLLLLKFLLLLTLGSASLQIDLLARVSPAYLWWNVALGLAIIPVAELLFRWMAHRYRGTQGLKGALLSLAGSSWRGAMEGLDAEQRFEQQLDAGELEVLQTTPLTPIAAQAMQSLRSRLLHGSLACAAALLLIVGFHVLHDGQLGLVICGVVLHLFVLLHLVTQLVHRSELHAENPHTLAEKLERMLELRRRIAAVSLVLAPLLALPLTVVSAALLWHVDLFQLLSTGMQWGLLTVMLALSAALAVLWRRQKQRFLPTALEVLCLGTLAASRRLLKALK